MPASSKRGATRVEDRGEGGANHANCVTTAHLAQRNLARTLRPRIARGGVTRFTDEERLSRHRAAERLADIAYALTVGGTLEVRAGGDRIRVPVPEKVLLTRGTGPRATASSSRSG